MHTLLHSVVLTFFTLQSIVHNVDSSWTLGWKEPGNKTFMCHENFHYIFSWMDVNKWP